MGKIPVLNDTQSERLKHLLAQNKIDLTKRGGKQTRLPTMPEEADVIVTGSSYNGPFAVSAVESTMVTIDSYTITVDSEGTTPALMVRIKDGAINVADSRYIVYGLSSSTLTSSDYAIPVPNDYALYYVRYLNRVESSGDLPYTSTFVALPNEQPYPKHMDGVIHVKLAENRGGVMKQVQFGEITDLEKPPASKYNGPFAVKWASAYEVAGQRYYEVLPEYWSSKGINIDVANGTCTCTLAVLDTTEKGFGNISRGWGGEIVNGNSHIHVDQGGCMVTFGVGQYAEIYIYKDLEDNEYKYIGIPSQLNGSNVNPATVFGNRFYSLLATVKCSYVSTYSSGIVSSNYYSSSIQQNQYGDIVDVDYATNSYEGPFHVKVNGGLVESDGVISGTFEVYDDTFEPTIVEPFGSAGHIVQGADRTIVSAGHLIPFKYYPAYDLNPTNVYLYEDVNSTGRGRWKFFAVDRILRDYPAQIPFSGFFTRIATIGGLGNGRVTVRQMQYGDVVDVDVGGSTVINSSSIYSSSITSEIHTSTVYSSSIYTSTIYSSSIALEYMGPFCVAGAIVSSGTPDETFVATVYDGTDPSGDVAGAVIVGNTASYAGTSSIICPIGSSVYLIGTVSGNSVEVEYSAYDSDPTVQDDQFFTRLACNSGGTMTQTQYGDIVQPVKNEGGVTGIEYSIDGGTVTISLTGGTGAVKFVGDEDTVELTENENDEIVISAHVSGGTSGEGGWIPYWAFKANDFDEVNKQTVVELYTKFGTGNANGYIPEHNGSAFVPASDCYVYAWAHLKSTGTAASAHVVVNGAQFKICYIKTDGAGITIGNGITIPVRAGQSINISYDDGGNTGYAQICMVCYEKGLDSDFAPTISVNHQIFVRYIQGDAQGAYAWKMDQTIVYSTSRSPDYGDTVWTTPELTVPYGSVD